MLLVAFPFLSPVLWSDECKLVLRKCQHLDNSVLFIHTAHSCNRSMVCSWTGHTQAVQNKAKSVQKTDRRFVFLCTWTRTHCRLPFSFGWILC